MEYEYSLGQYVVGSSGTLYGSMHIPRPEMVGIVLDGWCQSVISLAETLHHEANHIPIIEYPTVTFRHFENPSNLDLVEIWLNVRGYLSKRSWPSCSTR